MKKYIVLLLITVFAFHMLGQIPQGYYDSANGLSGEALRSELHNIIKNHTSISYNALWNAYKTTDIKPNGKVWDIYSNCGFNFTSDQCGTYSNICDCYNREHTVPQSWFNSASPMVSDIFHVLPTDGKVNGYRSNYPYGECANGTVYGLGKLGTSTFPGYHSIVFEPADEYKGDIARIYFYMATRYMNIIQNWGGESFSGNNLSVWTQNLMVKWHLMDPVSQKEIDRNNKIYTNYQHNRNPYVDHPEWVAEIWGDGSAVVDPQNYSAYPFSSDQINLVWSLNPNADNILLAYNTVNSFGTPMPDNTISGSGIVLAYGNITSFEHSGLPYKTHYYKIWSKNPQGDFSPGVVVSAIPYKAEPKNHVTNFRYTYTTSNSITLAWNDAEGDPEPDRYLIVASPDSTLIPVDGIPTVDGTMSKNINQNVQLAVFDGLEENKTYHFTIFPYTNYGAAIDYNTNNAPTITVSADESIASQLILTEIAGRGYNGNFNDEYIEISNVGGVTENLSGYTLEYYESTLEANLNLTGNIQPNSGYVIAVRTTHTSAIKPNFVPTTSFSINNPCYVILKKNGNIVDQAGTQNDKFNAKDKNYELIYCNIDNLITDNWNDLGSANGTPGLVNCTFVSIDESLTHTLTNLYPNPVENILNIETDSNNSGFCIYDIFGRVVGNYEKNTTQIDVSNLNRGIYFVRFNETKFSAIFIKN